MCGKIPELAISTAEEGEKKTNCRQLKINKKSYFKSRHHIVCLIYEAKSIKVSTSSIDCGEPLAMKINLMLDAVLL